MSLTIANPAKLECDTCHQKVETLQRVVLLTHYNALNKRALWNCKECYDKKIEIESENDKRLDLFNINWWPYVITDGNSAW